MRDTIELDLNRIQAIIGDFSKNDHPNLHDLLEKNIKALVQTAHTYGYVAWYSPHANIWKVTHE